MYKYSEKDKIIVFNRVEQFRGQIHRRLKGKLTEEEFKPLRLMNGLYLQLHAYMLRIAIPYGELSSNQLRKISEIAQKYDRGYGHFTTRQNIQLNWPKLTEVPKILEELAKVEMHAIQTSGNCIRNISSDHLAGLTNDEIEDPRPWCEIIRKWSTFHPEFSFLPRKFKIAVTGCQEDRAAILVHDIGLKLVKIKNQIGFEVYVGGGQGRTPHIAKKIHDFLPKTRVAILENSTAGIECMMHGVPIISYGWPEYHWVTQKLQSLTQLNELVSDLSWHYKSDTEQFIHWYINRYLCHDLKSTQRRTGNHQKFMVLQKQQLLDLLNLLLQIL